jgi:hypothetical protein
VAGRRCPGAAWCRRVRGRLLGGVGVLNHDHGKKCMHNARPQVIIRSSLLYPYSGGSPNADKGCVEFSFRRISWDSVNVCVSS